jgi:uncharacterized protein
MIPSDVPGIPTIEELMAIAESNFKIDLNGIHGRSHWLRVTGNAQHIVKTDGGDLAVATCFGMLHDCCRNSDYGDHRHGHRASELILKIRLGLDPKQLRLLFLAIREHSEAKVSAEPTIGACWDADRLELPRIGSEERPFYVDPEYLSTTTGAAMCQGLAKV